MSRLGVFATSPPSRPLALAVLRWTFLSCVLAVGFGALSFGSPGDAHFHLGPGADLHHSHFHVGSHEHPHEGQPTAPSPEEDPADDSSVFVAQVTAPPQPSAPATIPEIGLRPRAQVVPLFLLFTDDRAPSSTPSRGPPAALYTLT